MHLAKLPQASCRSPTALKRPDRSKQCHCLQFDDKLLNLLYFACLLGDICKINCVTVVHSVVDTVLLKSKALICKASTLLS